MRKLVVLRMWSIIESGSRIILSVSCDEEKANTNIDGKPFMAMPLKNGKSVELEITD